MGNKSQNHHVLYQQAQRQTLEYVWDNTMVSLTTQYHQEITNLQRNGVPVITTCGLIQIDKCRGVI